MKRSTLIMNAVAAAACFFLLSRPDRLWSSVPPDFDGAAMERLSPYSVPVLESADNRPSKTIKDRVYGLYGIKSSEGTVLNGEHLDQVLRRAGVSPVFSAAFSKTLATVFDLRTMRPGDNYQVWVGSDGNLLSFNYRKSPVEIYEADWTGKDWRVVRVNVPVERREAVISGDVTGSLWESFSRAGADPDLIMSFVDLFGWDVDFAHESQPGDQFRVVYQVLYADGQPVGNGRILAASYRDSNEAHYAVYWESGKTKGYFDQKGQSVRKSFLRSPVNFNRISSRFSFRRLHPVTHDVRPHMGVDFAAPIGTPVWAVADGTVTFVGNSGGSGRMISIRHAQGYETSYLHLSRFASSVRSGGRVSQGNVIGFVGSTGTSTGPHLDFRVKKDGRWVNPLKEKYMPGTPVASEEMVRYRQWAGDWMDRLAALPVDIKVAEKVR
jgi:murein DD-endopeptidase MepM/ murein hydrolase activator NlpD